MICYCPTYCSILFHDIEFTFDCLCPPGMVRRTGGVMGSIAKQATSSLSRQRTSGTSRSPKVVVRIFPFFHLISMILHWPWGGLHVVNVVNLSYNFSTVLINLFNKIVYLIFQGWTMHRSCYYYAFNEDSASNSVQGNGFSFM